NPLAVWAARRYFHLPYFHARIGVRTDGDVVRCTSRGKEKGRLLEASYRPTSAPYQSEPGTLEHWLTERYCLYARSPDGAIWRSDVHHVPWPLQAAEAEISQNTYLSSHGLSLVGRQTLLDFARRTEVAVWQSRGA